jgi:hypothetical protein
MAPTGTRPHSQVPASPPTRKRLWRVAVAVLGLATVTGLIRPTVGQTASGWPVQLQLAGFHLHTTEQPDLKLTELLGPVAQLRRDMCLRLGVEPPPGQVHVVLLAGEAEYRRYMQHYFPQLPRRRALFVKDQGTGMVFTFRHPELISDLRHECAHAVLQELFPQLPLWLDEGLAEYFEVEPAAVGRHPLHLAQLSQAQRPDSAGRGQTHAARITPLGELESLTDLRQMGPDQYRQAWLWTSFLLDGPAAGRAALGAYLASLQAHRWTPPLSQRLAAAEPHYQEKFERHIEQLIAAADLPAAAPTATHEQFRAASTERQNSAAARRSTSRGCPPNRVAESGPSG